MASCCVGLYALQRERHILSFRTKETVSHFNNEVRSIYMTYQAANDKRYAEPCPVSEKTPAMKQRQD
jgi:hypothetical protein